MRRKGTCIECLLFSRTGVRFLDLVHFIVVGRGDVKKESIRGSEGRKGKCHTLGE